MSVFDRVPTFKWTELGGKTLEISVGRDSGYLTVIGKDSKTGVMYVLHHSHETEGVK